MNIINVFDIIKKNAEHVHLSIVAKVQIILFFILFSYFEVVVHGTGAQYIFLDSLASKYGKSVSQISLMLGILGILFPKMMQSSVY